MGDATAFSRTACYNMEMAAFYTKWLKDVVDAQSPQGGFSDVSPRVVDMADGAPAWGDAGVYVPYEVYRAYGDTRVIEQMWGPMEAWMNYIGSVNPTFIRTNRRNNDFGDWVPANSETPKDLIATAFWAEDARRMTEMAGAIGRSAESAKYAELLDNIKNAYRKRFIKDDGTIGNGSQTCYVLSLAFGLVPDPLKPAAVNKLVQDIQNRGGHLSCGFLGTPFLLPVLSDNGRNDVAYRLLLNEDYPSWGYMIKNGATTMWERWNSDKEGPAMNSRNHYAFGSVGQWMVGYLAGIDTSAGSPGFKGILIHPQVGSGVTFARAEYDSVQGKIVSDWSVRPDGAFTLNVTVPANTTATVSVPVGDKSRVTEAGRTPDSREGVRFLRMESGRALYHVPAGSYKFVVAKESK
jgi:alpha-L-rhamnosidase